MNRINSSAFRLRAIAAVAALAGVLGLSGCASFAGIGSDRQVAQAGDFATQRSLSDPNPGAPNGQWPGSDWVRQFGDAQLVAQIGRAHV